MRQLRCEKCEITAAPSWAFLWYSKSVPQAPRRGCQPRTLIRWLCPDCAEDLGSEQARDAFLLTGIGPTEQ